MYRLSPATVADLAQGVYDAQDTMQLKLFIMRPEFSAATVLIGG